MSNSKNTIEFFPSTYPEWISALGKIVPIKNLEQFSKVSQANEISFLDDCIGNFQTGIYQVYEVIPDKMKCSFLVVLQAGGAVEFYGPHDELIEENHPARSLLNEWMTAHNIFWLKKNKCLF